MRMILKKRSPETSGDPQVPEKEIRCRGRTMAALDATSELMVLRSSREARGQEDLTA